MYICHFRCRDSEDICDFSFDIMANSLDEALSKACEAIWESSDAEGFIEVPLSGGAVNGKIAFNPEAINRSHLISFEEISGYVGDTGESW